MSSTARSSNSSAIGRSPFLSASAMAPSYSLELPIAFSKIEGFDVTPLTPSLSISLFRSPLTTKPRARKSSQTDWPCCSSALTGFMMPCSVRASRYRFQHPALAGGAILSTNPWEGVDGEQYAYPPGITPLTTYRSPGKSAVWLISRRNFVTRGLRVSDRGILETAVRDPNAARGHISAMAKFVPDSTLRFGSLNGIQFSVTTADQHVRSYPAGLTGRRNTGVISLCWGVK